VLVRRDGALFLADAGSTNGLWLGEQRVRCARLRPGVEYSLSFDASLVWDPLD
jgi:hypothetical protein